MKNKKWTKLLVVALSCMMVFAMTACGGGSSEGGEEAAAGAGTLHLGGVGPLTGPAALYGNAVKNGAQLAVDEINAANPDGVQLAWDMQDDEHDAEKSVNAYNKLVDDGMQILVGTVTSAPCTAVAAEAFANRTFALTPSASAPAVTEGNDNVFQLCFSDPNQGIASADYIAKNYPDATVGVIYNNADNYSTGIYDKFKSEYEGAGKKIAAAEAFSDDANADFTAQLNSLKDAGVDLIFLPIYYTPASNIMTQANKMGYEPTYFGVDGMDGILDLEGFDTSLAEGVLLLTPFTPYSDDAKVQEFVKAYEDAYGETPIQFAADAYDCVYAVYDAFQKTGLGTDASMEDICEAMIQVFTGGDFTASGLTAETMTWNEAGEVDKTPKVCVIEDGKYVEK
ncbi:MAG: amino acid ABC transporter substrate-binding protein [Clostridiales bacterium]|nr:amino acid ABC transporter substrate-binding protein [Clostridiales bacterium]